MTTMQRLRSQREAQALRILAQGGKYSRADIIREFVATRCDPISEGALKKMLLDFERRGLVSAEKETIRGAFSHFRFVYRTSDQMEATNE